MNQMNSEPGSSQYTNPMMACLRYVKYTQVGSEKSRNSIITRTVIIQAILAAKHLKASTLTHKGLNYIDQNNLFGTEHGGRDNVTNILMVITDGKSGYKDLTVTFAGIFKSKGIKIITVGVGKELDRDELTAVASNLKSRFYSASYDMLDYIQSDLVTYTCAASA